jgi:hypothetical protein
MEGNRISQGVTKEYRISEGVTGPDVMLLLMLLQARSLGYVPLYQLSHSTGIVLGGAPGDGGGAGGGAGGGPWAMLLLTN